MSSPGKNHSRLKAGRDSGGRGPEPFVPGPEFTRHMVAKARMLIDKGLFAPVGDGACQVASSDGSSYLAAIEPNSCQCTSFKIRRVCSHVLVAQMVAFARGGPVDARAAGRRAPGGSAGAQ